MGARSEWKVSVCTIGPVSVMPVRWEDVDAFGYRSRIPRSREEWVRDLPRRKRLAWILRNPRYGLGPSFYLKWPKTGAMVDEAVRWCEEWCRLANAGGIPGLANSDAAHERAETYKQTTSEEE